ncbi:hypothetical protein DPMN_141464 [Dreissena polymorpha]|uniref:Vwde helical domain-containing protein n=1 Tax=Dreissena polymorpha TaxID=45954 RepID=A0A9D4G9F6_DREPO|nr:hypothetical protein DPMN_141464 [Dreissena polymorpha]
MIGEKSLSQEFDVILEVRKLYEHDFFDNYILPPIKQGNTAMLIVIRIPSRSITGADKTRNMSELLTAKSHPYCVVTVAVRTGGDVYVIDLDMTVRSRRSKTVIDFDTARQLCVEQMNTTTVQLCLTVPGLDIDSYYDDCASDYLASNSMEWVQIHIEGIKQTCIQYLEFHKPISPEIIRNVTLIDEYKTNATSVSTTSAPILDPDSVTEL